jgi:hypothetical protein
MERDVRDAHESTPSTSGLRPRRDGRVVNAETHIDAETLIREIARYLAAIELFRVAGYEPAWRPELESSDPLVLQLGAYGQTASPAGS